jgi:hypothetical protein
MVLFKYEENPLTLRIQNKKGNVPTDTFPLPIKRCQKP